MNWKAMMIAGVLTMSGAAVVAQSLQYPAARMSDQMDVYFGVKVHDPYRWMEDVDSPEVKTWLDAENALTQQFLADVPQREKIHARLVELNNFERVSAPEKEGGRYFFRRNSGLQNQAVLYWQQGSTGEPKALLDPNTLASDGTVALQSTAITDDGKLIAYSLSDAGSDLEKIHVKIVATGQDLPDLIEWVKFSGISWMKNGSGFFYSSYGVPKTEEERAAALKSVGSFHKVYFHKLGTPQTADMVVFERRDDKEMLSGVGVSEDGRWLVISQGKGDKNALWVKDLTQRDWESTAAPVIKIAPVDDAIYEWIGSEGRTVWMRTTKDAPNGKIVRLDLNFEPPEHPQATAWKTVVAEQGNSLESAVMVHGTIIASYLADAQSDVELYTPDGKLIEKLKLPGIGLAGVNGGKRGDEQTFFTFTNYTTPPTVYKLDLKTLQTSVWKAPKLVFDPAEYETKQVFATSKDGTQVTLFITYKKTTKLDGNAPAILYGYGGFNVSLGPAYASSRLAWMEMGGIYAEAILRGGGEYGEKWHEAGTKTQKQNVFDDFIGCAEYLIKNSYTSPKKLAINGGSNGGLLVGAVELQRPGVVWRSAGAGGSDGYAALR